MNTLLRYSLLCLLSFSTLVSCKSVDRVLFRSPSAAFEQRLPNLEVVVDNGPLAATDGSLPEDPQKLFQRELSQNIIDPADSTKFGYVKLVVTSAETMRKGKGLQALQMATLMIPSLFGVPLEYYQTNVRAEVQIIDSRGEVLGLYKGSGVSNVRVALYHGYSQTDAGRLADIDALRQALSAIRPQIDGNAEALRAKLLAGGPVEPMLGETASGQ